MNKLFARRERPSADALAALDRDERLVSWADTDGSGHVLATTLGLWWPCAGAPPRRLCWQHIDKVTWRQPALTVIAADVQDDIYLVDRAPVTVTLTRPRDLPSIVRKRVQTNIVSSELATVAGGAVRFVARRLPGRDGATWWARLEPGTRDTEAVRSAVTARLAILRAEWEDARR